LGVPKKQTERRGPGHRRAGCRVARRRRRGVACASGPSGPV